MREIASDERVTRIMKLARKIRVRHYTKKSSADKILKEGVIKAGIKTHKVFVERARRKLLAPEKQKTNTE